MTWRRSTPPHLRKRSSLPRLDRAGAGGYGNAVLEERGCMALDSLKVLETKVERVLTLQSALGEERDRLKQELDEARSRLESMTDQLAEIERERAEIRTRVDSLLGRLEELNV